MAPRRLTLVRLALAHAGVIACVPRATPAEPRGPEPEERSARPSLVGMDALVARLDLANAQTGEVAAVGRQELVDGGWNLELDDRVIAQLERDGSSCAPDQLPRQDVVLIEFAGAVPLVLVASVPPMFIGLDEDADALRCWPLRELPRRQSVDERPPPQVSVSRNWHPDSSTPASVALDLLPERAGTESLKLALAGDTLSLSLSAADGELLLTWSSDAHCERQRAGVYAQPLAGGVALEIDLQCMIVDKLETGYSDSAIYSAWWPGSGPVQVAEVQRWSSEYVNGDDLTTLSQSVSTRHSRPLTHAVLTVENERSMTERHERVCNPDNASDCCRRISSSTTLNEVWELELEGDDGPRLRRSGAAPFSESHSKGCEALAPQ